MICFAIVSEYPLQFLCLRRGQSPASTKRDSCRTRLVWGGPSGPPFPRVARTFRLDARKLRDAFDDAENLVLADDQIFLAIDFDFAAGVLAEEHRVTGLHVQGQHLALVVDAAASDGDDLALLRFFLGGVGD